MTVSKSLNEFQIVSKCLKEPQRYNPSRPFSNSLDLCHDSYAILHVSLIFEKIICTVSVILLDAQVITKTQGSLNHFLIYRLIEPLELRPWNYIAAHAVMIHSWKMNMVLRLLEQA